MTALEKKYQINKRVRIKRIIPTSLIDWAGMVVATLYVGGCNFRCPYCFNVELVKNSEHLKIISEEDIFSFLKQRKSFLDGICLTGGEPTICSDLAEFLSRVRKQGLKIKLDTNGSHPEKLTSIIKQGLVDYIAMDIKSNLQLSAYQQATGIRDDVIANIKKSIALIRDSGIEYEFRTTVVPYLHDEKTIEEIAQEIKGVPQYILQSFHPSENLLDTRFTRIKPYSPQKMEELRKKILPLIPGCIVR